VQDFRDFLNLELAVANPTAPRSVRYFFSIFDLDQKGYIIEHDLAYFLKVSLACSIRALMVGLSNNMFA
jgi:Ca2+-binding EF-hand superfamily protein